MRRWVLIGLAAIAIAALAQTIPAGPRILLARAAEAQVGVTTIYDPGYVRLPYPGGDVPINRGVCTDVVIRAFRKIGVDLQLEVHRDMKRAFREYPQRWGLSRPDPSIDHRRVPNLAKYLERRGKSAPRSGFEPGDIVTWRLPNGLPHIGIVSTQPVPRTSRHYVVHNIGAGAQIEDILHAFEITGHYRW